MRSKSIVSMHRVAAIVSTYRALCERDMRRSGKVVARLVQPLAPYSRRDRRIQQGDKFGVDGTSSLQLCKRLRELLRQRQRLGRSCAISLWRAVMLLARRPNPIRGPSLGRVLLLQLLLLLAIFMCAAAAVGSSIPGTVVPAVCAILPL
jgi:hypothetical protein